MLRFALKLSCLCMLPVLAGCASLLATGAAPVGQHSTQGDRSALEYRRDADITSAINSRYVKDDLISAFDVNITTYSGTVTLSGTVRSRQAEQRAVALARSVQGVGRVVSRLTIAAR